MNDDDMLAAMRNSLTSIKDSLADVHLDQSPDAIIARARGRRLRRSLPGITAGALALAAGLAVTLPGSSPVQGDTQACRSPRCVPHHHPSRDAGRNGTGDRHRHPP